MKGTFFLISKSRLGLYRPHDPIEGYSAVFFTRYLWCCI